MATDITNALARWQKPGVYVAGCGAIADVDAPEHILQEVGNAWANFGMEVSTWDINLSGKPLPDDAVDVVGRHEPEFSFVAPITEMNLAYFMTSLLQSEVYAAGPPADYTPIIYTIPVAAVPLYQHVLIGIAGQSVFSVAGCIVRDLTIDIPMSGADGGKATLTPTYIGRSVIRQAAFGGGTPAIDTYTKKLSKDHSLLISEDTTQAALAAAKFTSLNLTMTNNAKRDPNVGEYAEAYVLGKYEAKGTLSVMITSGANEEYDNLYDAYEAGTVLAMQFGVDPTGVDTAGDYSITQSRVEYRSHGGPCYIRIDETYSKGERMERWIDGTPVAVVLPGGRDPKTAWHIIQATDEEAGLLEGAIANLRDAVLKAGGNVNNAGHIQKEAEQDRAALADRIAIVENVNEEGDEVTSKAEIRELLNRLAAGRYRALRNIIMGLTDITLFERK
jgi:hypothetical protein